jgi:hypothetical protein
MKNRSFLFLIAALAMGLALIGCSTDDGGSTTTVTDYRGFASQVDAIAAAFEQAPDVYLTGPVEVGSDEMLLVKSGNRLHLESFTITVDDGGGIAIEDAGGIVWDTGSVTGATENNAYLIGPSGAFTGKSVTNVVTLDITAAGDEEVAYTNVNDRAIGATTDYTKVFDSTTGAAKAPGGTLTVLITPSFTVPNTHYSNAGSLAVTGNVTLAGTLAGDGGFEVYGELTSSVDDTENPTLVEGDLTARTIKTAGGDFGATVTIKSSTIKSEFGGTQTTVTGAFSAEGPVNFTGAAFTDTSKIGGAAAFAKPVTFTGAATLTSANFSDDVTFSAASTINGKATFAKDKTVVGKVTVGQLSAGATGTNTLLLGPDGHIIYTGSVENSFLTGVGTLAALGGVGTLSFSIGLNELEVSGAGSFVVNNAISLTESNQIKVDGATGVYFAKTDGKIVTETYELGGVAGTLSGGLILSVNEIKGTESTVADDRPTVDYVVADTTGGIILKVNAASTLTLSNINLGATAGTIAFGTTSKLYLNAGGSITAKGGSLAHGGYIVTASNGSIAAGKVGDDDADAVAAGSVGTTANAAMYLSQKNYFFNSAGSATTDVLNLAVTKPEEVKAGSITVFADK